MDFPKEERLLELSAKLWNEFLAQGYTNPVDRADFRKAIHDIQRIIATSIARKVTPHLFTKES